MTLVKTTGPTTPGSKRQLEYVARLKAKGYAQVTSLYVPRVLIPEIREMVQKRIAKWEKDVSRNL